MRGSSFLHKRRLRRWFVLGLGVATLVASTPANATIRKTAPSMTSAAPTLATDRLLFDSDRTGNFEIMSMRTDGTDPQRMTTDPRYDSWWPKPSPDRATILFYRTPAGTHDRDYTKTS